MKNGNIQWDKLSQHQRFLLNPDRHYLEINKILEDKFQGKYSLFFTMEKPPIFFKKKYGNRNIQFLRLLCNTHKKFFISSLDGLKRATKFLKNCEGCKIHHNKSAGLLDYNSLNDKLRSSESELIRNHHYIAEIPKTKTKKINRRITLKCNRHDIIFTQYTQYLGINHGCPACNRESGKYSLSENEIRKDVQERLELIKEGLSTTYSYINHKKVNNHYKISFLCKSDKHDFPYPFQYFKDHLHLRICPKCYPSDNESIGEEITRDILLKNNLSFKRRKTLPGCKFKQPLHFDFYIKSLNLVIEFDGEQHFKKMGYDNDSSKFIDCVKRDLIKNSFCEKNKINLLRIPYYLLKNENQMIVFINKEIDNLKKENSVSLLISNYIAIIKYYNDFYKDLRTKEEEINYFTTQLDKKSL